MNKTPGDPVDVTSIEFFFHRQQYSTCPLVVLNASLSCALTLDVVNGGNKLMHSHGKFNTKKIGENSTFSFYLFMKKNVLHGIRVSKKVAWSHYFPLKRTTNVQKPHHSMSTNG